MHSFPLSDERRVPRSKLGATLLRLHRNLEGSRQREQAALELFETWQSRWSDHREVIAQRLECLDQELAQLASPHIPSPHLSLMAICENFDEESDVTLPEGGESRATVMGAPPMNTTGATPPHSHHSVWHDE